MMKRDFKNGEKNMLKFLASISHDINNEINENKFNLEDIATKAGISYDQALNTLNLKDSNISSYYSLKKTIDNEKIKKL